MSLEYYKMEKMLRGVIDKGYSRTPSDDFTLKFMIGRLKQEFDELEPFFETFICFELNKASGYYGHINAGQICNFKRELADVCNFIDFIYQKLFLMEFGGEKELHSEGGLDVDV